MKTKTLSYEELKKEKVSLEEKMKVARENDQDIEYCKLYLIYKNIVQQIQEIDDYWNAHD